MDKTHHIMRNIGQRIRWRRENLGLSQKALSQSLGVTAQQIRKYEIGSNTISAVRLYYIGHILGVPQSFFFEETLSIDPDALVRERATLENIQENNPLYQAAIELTEAFVTIRDPNVRSKILGLAKDLAHLKR